MIRAGVWTVALLSISTPCAGLKFNFEHKDSIPSPPNDMPSAMIGRNLVIAGDSVDRYAVEQICMLYNGQANSFNLTKMNADAPSLDASFAHLGARSVSGDGRGGFGCHMKDFNASLLYLHHPGAMSSPPQPSWHADKNQGNSKRKARLWQTESGITINASTDLARIYWRNAVNDNLPKRPVILVAQSSLWDSILAKESLQDAYGVSFTAEIPVEKHRNVLDTWAWDKHVEDFLQAIWNSGLPVEKKIWRTNANCPVTGKDAHFVNMVSHAQANEARRLIAQNQGPWQNVVLMDWRKDFNATSPGWCNGIHYSVHGYYTYIQSLWDAISESRL